MKNRKEGQSALRYAVFGGLALIASCLSGCVAAIPAMYAGSAILGGLTAASIVQSQRDPNVGVNFKPAEIENKSALAAMTKLAIWPNAVNAGATNMGPSSAVYSSAALAEQLSNKAGLIVVTPFAVSKVLESNGLGLSHGTNMTESEQRDVFKLVAEKTGADAVLYSTLTGMKFDMKMWSLARSTTSNGAIVQVYSVKDDAIILRLTGEIVYTQGAGMPNTAEGERLFIAELVKSLSNSRGIKTSLPATSVASSE